ncbi:hypothetical protein OAM69_05310 [bacterium]|nr:hypothetical protein [bacterium]
MKPLRARKVKPAIADVEGDGPDEPELRAVRRKGSCLYNKGHKSPEGHKGEEAQASI